MAADTVQPKVTVTYTLVDFYASMARRWSRWLAGVGAITIVVVALPMLTALANGCSLRCAPTFVDWQASGFIPVAIAVWLLLIPLLLFFSFKRRGNLVPITFLVTEEGIRLETAKSRSEVFWTALKRVKRAKSGLLLYPSHSQPVAIPRRAFADQEHFDAFSAAAEERWKAHHRL
jgi:hypothetical protein